MLKNNLAIVFSLFAMICSAQWSNTSDNTTSGNLSIGQNYIGSPELLYVSATGSKRAVGLFGATGTGEAGIYFDASNGDWSGSDYASLLQLDDGSVQLNNYSNNSIDFRTNGITRATLQGDGKLGIGTSSPKDQIDIEGGLGGSLRLSAGNTSYLTSQTVRTGIIRSVAKQWNADYSATNTNETSMIIFDYYGHQHGQVFDAAIRFYTQEDASGPSRERMSIVGDNVGIGTNTPTEKLSVNGTIRSKEVKVEANNWPDYVFEEHYNLATLEEIEAFIESNGHLPEVPSAAEVEAEGLVLGEMNRLLLMKIEELTLYLIEANKEKEELSQRLTADSQSQEKKIEELILYVIELKERNDQQDELIQKLLKNE